MLGSTHAPVDTNLFPHSWGSFSLRSRFREMEISRRMMELRILSFSGVLSSPGLDRDKVENIFTDLYDKLRDSIPYLKHLSGPGKSSIDEEREKLVEAYWKMVEESRKNKDMNAPEQEKTDG